MTLLNTKKSAEKFPLTLEYHKILKFEDGYALVQLAEEGKALDSSKWYICPHPVQRVGHRTIMVTNSKEEAKPIGIAGDRLPVVIEGRHVLAEVKGSEGIATWYLLQSR